MRTVIPVIREAFSYHPSTDTSLLNLPKWRRELGWVS